MTPQKKQAIAAALSDPGSKAKIQRRFLMNVSSGPQTFEGSECWNWTGKNPSFSAGRVQFSAARLSVPLWSGGTELFPKPFQKCGNNRCVRPEHIVEKQKVSSRVPPPKPVPPGLEKFVGAVLVGEGRSGLSR